MVYWPLTKFNGGALLTADYMNQIVDNFDYLRTPPQYVYNRGFTDANYSTASTEYVDIDATNMAPALDFTGNPVLVIFRVGRMTHSAALALSLTLAVDGIDVSGGNYLWYGGSAYQTAINLTYVLTGLSPGIHTVKPMMKVSANTVTLLSASGIQYFVREI